MTSKSKYSILLVFFSLFFFLIFKMPSSSRPVLIDVPSMFPGQEVGNFNFSWVAPFVSTSSITINKTKRSKVTWYSKSGEVLKEIEGQRLEASSLYILDQKLGTTLVYSIYDTSSILLTHTKWKDGSITGKNYGKIFLFDYQSGTERYIEYYLRGKLVQKFGPYPVNRLNLLTTNNSGSYAFMENDKTNENSAIIKSFDSLGAFVFEFEINKSLTDFHVSSNGARVLVQFKAKHPAKQNLNYFSIYSLEENNIKEVSFHIQDGFLDWVPSSSLIITMGSIGSDFTYGSIDLKTGKKIWNTKDPLEFCPMTNYHGMVVTNQYLILSGLSIKESIGHGPIIPNDFKGPTRMLAAINVRTGDLVSKWYEPTFSGKWQLSTGLPPMPNRGGTLILFENEVYYITDQNFLRIDESDIGSFRNGWSLPQITKRTYFDVFR